MRFTFKPGKFPQNGYDVRTCSHHAISWTNAIVDEYWTGAVREINENVAIVTFQVRDPVKQIVNTYQVGIHVDDIIIES